LGWPKGDRESGDVSRETGRSEPETPATHQNLLATDVAPGGGDPPDNEKPAQQTAAARAASPGPAVGPNENQVAPNDSEARQQERHEQHEQQGQEVAGEEGRLEGQRQHSAEQGDQHGHDGREDQHLVQQEATASRGGPNGTDASPSGRHERPVHYVSREPVSMLQATSPAPPGPLDDPELGSLEDADPLPERQYATADAFGSRADSESRVSSSGLPEVRMSTSNDQPAPETEPPAISVSVTRPWLEVDPAPGFRHAQRLEEQSRSSSPTPTLTPPTGSQPLIESISLMDDSTPLALEVAEDTRRRIELAGRQFPRPKDTRVITVSNQKGGVGKTTSTVNMAAALAQAGLRVLVLDIDPQGNASTALGIEHHGDVPSIYDVLVEGRPLHEVVQQCPDVENLWCAPATVDLAGAEIELVSLVARESRLQRAVSTYLEAQTKGVDRLDYILIDCPPSLGLLTVNAFVAAHEVLIPIQCEYYALEGLSQLLRNVELIRGHLNPTLHVSTILLTMYDGRTRLSSQVADEVRSHFPSEVLRTTVPRSVRISEAPSHGQTVMTYDPASSGALSYLEAARELAEQVLGTGSEDALPTEDRS
jgi:chromosome partitioning protein